MTFNLAKYFGNNIRISLVALKDFYDKEPQMVPLCFYCPAAK